MKVQMGHSNTVVVGVDGSESAQRAVRWAAEEAVRRSASLRIVHAELPLPADALDMTGMARGALHDEAWRWVHHATGVAGKVDPELEIQVRVEVHSPVWMLEEESETAGLVVVGSRGLGGFSGLLLGSVAVALSCHGKCPVVVVRGEGPVPGAPVVVGVDGAPENRVVVDRAFEEARAQGTSLIAVHAWDPPMRDEEIARGFGIVWSELDKVRAAMLDQRLEACADRYPGVRVERHVVHGSPARRLVELSAHASLLVVGSRGRGGFAGMVLGSTSQALIRHALCPVLIVRPSLAEELEAAAS